MADEPSKNSFSMDLSQDDGDEGSSPKSYRGGISLDVLAEVASATLKCEPGPSTSQPYVKERKPATKTLQSQDILTLSQIRNLSDKQLVPLFSELTSNELNRKYSYRCWLVPNECSKSFSSFGNEMKAKSQLTQHLRMHIVELAKQEDGESAKKKKKSPTPTPAVKKPYRQKKQFKQNEVINIKVPKDEPDQELYLQVDNGDEVSKSEEVMTGDPVVVKVVDEAVTADRPDTEHDLMKAAHTAELVKRTISENLMQSQLRSLMSSVFPDATITPLDNEGVAVATESQKTDNEQLITDLLRRSQPYQDHNYTTVFGKKEGIDEMYNKLSQLGEWEAGGSSSRTYPLKCNKGEEPQVMVNQLPQSVEIKLDSPPEGTSIQIPVIKLSRMLGFGHNTDFVEIKSKDQVISLYNIDSQQAEVKEPKDEASKPYPPMPKSDIAKKGKIPLPQEVYGSSDEEDSSILSPRKRLKIVTEGSVEWEKKMAMKYIRELRNKKHENQMFFQCRLCSDKSFTAAATLISHYRSHAGIKPYVCLICNTTFTRQHSLNYHMLIHNNQSRFTCKECGRKFRHPSHFKEHLRRHTGETPYQCPDCSMFFKTRNTYKRHLKTRHKKLLTAAGISLMETKSPSEPPSEETSLAGDFVEEYVNEGQEVPVVDIVAGGTAATAITADELTTAMLQAQKLVST